MEHSTSTSGFSRHDHDACISGAIEKAAQHCAKNGLQLTPVRRRVLEILLEAHTAMGAYEVLDRLAAEGLGSKPPMAYRALSFLTEHGFAHRIERLNAFVACTHPGAAHDPAFMICRACGTVAEAEAAMSSGPLSRSAEAAGFMIEQTVIEAEGLCPGCQPGPGQ